MQPIPGRSSYDSAAVFLSIARRFGEAVARCNQPERAVARADLAHRLRLDSARRSGDWGSIAPRVLAFAVVPAGLLLLGAAGGELGQRLFIASTAAGAALTAAGPCGRV